MKVKCVTMQKNERDLLLPWLKWHSYLFGFENIYVVDNGSTDKSVIKNLKSFENIGVNVIWDYNKKSDFVSKGAVVGNIIREMPNPEEDEFIIPLDCDEFLGVWQNGNISLDRNDIYSHLQELSRMPGHFRVVSNLYNIPGFAGWYWPQDAGKVFFRRRNFSGVDHGFHFGKTNPTASETISNIVYFHFHNKPHEQYIKHAWEKLTPFNDNLDEGNLAQWRGAGAHLIDGILIDPEKYIGSPSFISDMAIYIPDLGNKISALGGESGMISFSPSKKENGVLLCPCVDGVPNLEEAYLFNSLIYTKKWPDISESGIDPIKHYLLFGRKENRSIGEL